MLIQAIPLEESPAIPDAARQEETANDGLIIGDPGIVRTYGFISGSAVAEAWPAVGDESS